MSQTKNMNGYAMAGGQWAADDYFAVRDSVYVPDGEAGTDGASCFRAQPRRRAVRQGARPTMTLRSVVIFLSAVSLVCSASVLYALHGRKNVSQDISRMRQSMNQTQRDNEQLALEVAEARDASRVCYLAVNELGMIASEEARTRFIYVPEIEQFTKAEDMETQFSASGQGTAPGAQGQLAGSR